MFNFFRCSVEDELEFKVRSLEDDKAKLEARIKTLEERYVNDNRAADVCFDFEGTDVISIERAQYGNEYKTVICHKMEEPVFDGDKFTTKTVIEEWYCACDLTQHQRLVEMFNRSKAK